jgi:hypothetical protein
MISSTTMSRAMVVLSSVGGGPDRGHELVADAPVQEGAHRSELLVDVARQLVVDPVPVDLALRSFDEAVEGHRHEQDHLPYS